MLSTECFIGGLRAYMSLITASERSGLLVIKKTAGALSSEMKRESSFSEEASMHVLQNEERAFAFAQSLRHIGDDFRYDQRLPFGRQEGGAPAISFA